MSRVLVFLANGFEEIEAITSIDICRRGDIELTTVSIENTKMVEGAHGIKIEADKMLLEVDFSIAEMLLLPGGMPGTTNLEKNELLKSKIEEFNNNGKYIAAICAAPSILGKMGILNGRKATSYPSFTKYLAGAKVVSGSVLDDKILTSQGVGTAIDFALNIVKELKGEEKAKLISEAILYSK